MAYYLDFSQSNDIVTFNRIVLSGDYTISIKFKVGQNPNSDGIFLGDDSDTSWLGVFQGGLRFRPRDVQSPPIALPAGNTEYIVNVSRVGSLVTVTVEGVDSVSVTSSVDAKFSCFGRYYVSAQSAQFSGGVYSAEFFSEGVLVSRFNKQTLNSSNDTVFPDTVGGNDGTLVNFPTDNSQWVFYDDGGGSVDYTITLDSGSYSLTGNTLSLLSDRNISLENGSYSLTGTDLNLAVQRSINLSEGIYAKQGTNTSLVLERLLGLDTGAYTKVGNSIGLLVDRFIPLEQGSYSYLGSDINLQYGQEFRLSLEQGTYSLQGTEVGLLKDYILPLESASYSYTPENISILANRKINTESGSYSYVGSPINFIYEAGGITYTLSIDSGDYSLTGQSLKLLVNRKLPIDFGEYTYEGVNSELLYNRVVALGSGIYSSAGTDLGVKVNRRLVFQNGNYSLQGTPITLSYTGEVLAILEGYRLSYKKHPVKQLKYKPYNITARYN